MLQLKYVPLDASVLAAIAILLCVLRQREVGVLVIVQLARRCYTVYPLRVFARTGKV